MAEPLFNRLALIGIGHIGASIAGALALHPGTVGHLVIADANPAHLQRAEELHLGDEYVADAAQAVEGADAVILCTPVGSFAALAEMIAPHLMPGCVLSDVGSTKQSVIRDVGPFLPKTGCISCPRTPWRARNSPAPMPGCAASVRGPLVPAHPARKARTRRRCNKIETLWRTLGARTARMGARASRPRARHRLAICRISSPSPSAARRMTSRMRPASEVLQFAAAGFRDFTRIAASDPVMWRDIFVNNKEALLEMFSRFSEDAQAMARAVRWGDTDYIEDRINHSRKIRKSLIDIKQA